MKKSILIGWMVLMVFTFAMPAVADEWTSIPFVQYQFVPDPSRSRPDSGRFLCPASLPRLQGSG